MKRLLRGGHVVDPVQGIDGATDILLDGPRVAAVGPGLAAGADVEVIDVPPGFIVAPGFVDMHVHLREPGQEHKETIATGTAAPRGWSFGPTSATLPASISTSCTASTPRAGSITRPPRRSSRSLMLRLHCRRAAGTGPPSGPRRRW